MMNHIQKAGIAAFTTLGVAIVAAFVALQAIGIGHGSYIPAAFLFPFSILTGVVIHHTDGLQLAMALSQFPIYGTILGRAWLYNRLAKAAYGVAVVHAVAVFGSIVAMTFPG